jgi:mitogen-activated protein kinase organizer 1
MFTGEVMYWDLVEGDVVKKFRAHTGVVCSLAMHPQGSHLLTSALDGVVKVWAAEAPKSAAP